MSDSQTVEVGPDQVGTVRVLVGARPQAGQSGTTPIAFIVKDTATGETATYHGAFLSPPRA